MALTGTGVCWLVFGAVAGGGVTAIVWWLGVWLAVPGPARATPAPAGSAAAGTATATATRRRRAPACRRWMRWTRSGLGSRSAVAWAKPRRSSVNSSSSAGMIVLLQAGRAGERLAQLAQGVVGLALDG